MKKSRSASITCARRSLRFSAFGPRLLRSRRPSGHIPKQRAYRAAADIRSTASGGARSAERASRRSRSAASPHRRMDGSQATMHPSGWRGNRGCASSLNRSVKASAVCACGNTSDGSGSGLPRNSAKNRRSESNWCLKMPSTVRERIWGRKDRSSCPNCRKTEAVLLVSLA